MRTQEGIQFRFGLYEVRDGNQKKLQSHDETGSWNSQPRLEDDKRNLNENPLPLRQRMHAQKNF
jgi:hypothetical protein